MNEELQPKWYEDIKLSELKNIIKDNIGIAGRSFVTIGYYLKNIRDRELYFEDGYQNIWEFAQVEFGIGKSSASQFMSINDRFSVDGNSPLLLDQYKDFTSSKLAEMLTLSDEQLEQVTPVTTRTEIREMKHPVKEIDAVLHAEQKSEELITIDDLDFTVRTYNCLKRANINTINELCDLTEDKVIAIRNISRKCLDEINEKLSEIGRRLKQDYQLPDCAHEADTECNMVNIKPVAESLGMDCNGICCWGCKEVCGARCNASAHRPDVNNEPEIVDSEPEIVNDAPKITNDKCIHNKNYQCDLSEELKLAAGPGEECFSEYEEEQTVCCWDCSKHKNCESECNSSLYRKPDPVEIVEADIIQSEPEEIKQGTSYSLNSVYLLLQKAKSDYTEAVRVSGAPEKLVEKRLIIQDALLDYYQELRGRDTGWYQKPQPELPTLKNNDQRKEFIEAYQSWPVWIDQELTGERYYRYNLTDKVSMVVKVSKKHHHESWKETKDYEYGAEQYYLLGIKSEWTSKGSSMVEDDTRTFYECNVNKSALVEYLKEIQKK